MNDKLYEATRTAIDEFYDLNTRVGYPDNEGIKDVGDEIFKITRKLERACNDLMHQGTRIAVTSNFVYQCPKCAIDLENSDMLYVHYRKSHSDSDDEAAAIAHKSKQEYDDDIVNLRNLLIKHTKIMLEEDDPFQKKS